MKILIPGGSGHLGTILARSFTAGGDEVVVLSRRRGRAPWRTVLWDGATPGAWTDELDRCDVVINLAGRSVNCRYTAENRRQILESRVLSTRALGQAVVRAANPPRVWLQASTATIYSHRFDAPNDEITGELGGQEARVPGTWRFSIDVARAWEAAATEARTPRTRRVLMRTAMVMSPEPGGTFDLLRRLVRFGLGGAAAGGRQFVSWIHEADFVAAVRWLMTSSLEGAVNVASPEPLPYRDFIGTMRRGAGVAVGMPATRWMLEIGAAALRTETELILKSRRVTPRRLRAAGFVFRFPRWAEACEDLLHARRDRDSRSPVKFHVHD